MTKTAQKTWLVFSRIMIRKFLQKIVALLLKVLIQNFRSWHDQMPLLRICICLHLSRKFQIRTSKRSATKMVQKTWWVTACTTVQIFWWEIVALWSKVPIQNFRPWCDYFLSELLTVVRLKQFKKPGGFLCNVLTGNSRTMIKSSNSKLLIMVRSSAIIMYMHLVALVASSESELSSVVWLKRYKKPGGLPYAPLFECSDGK